MSTSSRSILHRAVALANRYPAQFTIQYPPSRRYFKSQFLNGTEQANSSSSMVHFPFYKDTFVPGKMSPHLLLYVHVPFCEHKCTYCNFAVDVRPAEKRSKIAGLYVQTLQRYLEKFEDVIHPDVVIPGVDIGGGTPTLLDEDLLDQLMRSIKQVYDKRKQPQAAYDWAKVYPADIQISVPSQGERTEDDWGISIESTPFIASNFPDKLRILRSHGVGRVSIGLQSASTELLSVRLTHFLPLY
jgi:oxygen-independent coproporphyrinogen-3 oxidase